MRVGYDSGVFYFYEGVDSTLNLDGRIEADTVPSLILVGVSYFLNGGAEDG